MGTLFIPRSDESFMRVGWQVGVSLVPGFVLGARCWRGRWDQFSFGDLIWTAAIFLGPIEISIDRLDRSKYKDEPARDASGIGEEE